MKVREYLRKTSPEQYHIFDSHQEAMVDRNMQHADQDYIAYSYNVHSNNKPKPGDAFLYRRPGKSSKTRKFYIYGGGIIESITTPDPEGFVLAKISKPFKLDEFIQQGDAFIENFVWTSKNKTPGSWGHFWNQYGMNVINEEDFLGLVGDKECSVPGNYNIKPATVMEAVEEEEELEEDTDVSGFSIEVSDDDLTGRMPISNGSKQVTGRHTDYVKLEKKKAKVGLAGELLVIDMLKEQLGDEAEIEHTSVVKGDGLGYDIKVSYKDGHTVYIEVKTTKTSYIDGFYITPRELNAAKLYGANEENNTEYLVYRVYNFDSTNKTANLAIYHGPFTDDKYKCVPTAWKVHLK